MEFPDLRRIGRGAKISGRALTITVKVKPSSSCSGKRRTVIVVNLDRAQSCVE